MAVISGLGTVPTASKTDQFILSQGANSYKTTGIIPRDGEEGNFSPYIHFGGDDAGRVYGISVGRYVKIGSFVHVQLLVSFSTLPTSATGIVSIANLPFNLISTANTHVQCGFRVNGVNFGSGTLQGYGPPAGSRIQLETVTSAGVITDLPHTAISINDQLMTSFTYETSS